MKKLYDTQLEKRAERAILMAIAPNQTSLQKEGEPSLAELEALVNACSGEVVAWVTQIRPARDAAHYIGSGKLEEIRELAERHEADLLVCDEELTGSQIRNLEKLTGLRVLDRTLVILDIFARHAQSHEGRLQVELAQQRYRLTRLTQQDPSALSRLGGGIGTRGPGETKLETDRRHIRRRIDALERELARVAAHRDRVRQARKREGRFVIAVVGYTNAGKSTLVNAFCRADVLAQDQLFATLDPTVRALCYSPEELQQATGLTRLQRAPVLVDTVGLIRRLPHTLVRAFESTLREAAEADLLLHVIQTPDPEALAHWRVTEGVLRELGAGELPILHVWNQMDRPVDPEQLTALRAQLHESTGDARTEPILISAKTGMGLTELKARLLQAAAED